MESCRVLNYYLIGLETTVTVAAVSLFSLQGYPFCFRRVIVKEGADKALSLDGQQFMTRTLKVTRSDPERASKPKQYVPLCSLLIFISGLTNLEPQLITRVQSHHQRRNRLSRVPCLEKQ